MKIQSLFALGFVASAAATSQQKYIFVMKKPDDTIKATSAAKHGVNVNALVSAFDSIEQVDGNFTASNGLKMSKNLRKKLHPNRLVRRAATLGRATNWVTVNLESEAVAKDIFEKNQNLFSSYNVDEFQVRLPVLDNYAPVAPLQMSSMSFDVDVKGTCTAQTDMGGYSLKQLCRLSSKTPNGDNDYYYNPSTAGKDVIIYVVDSGVSNMKEFKGTQSELLGGLTQYNYCNDDINDAEDENGHGSHVAGIAAAKGWGVAKKAEVHSYKVIDSSGRGQISWWLAALDELIDRHTSQRKKGVINMSLGTSSPVKEIDDKVVEIIKTHKIPVVAAAGNENRDAKGTSPGGVPEVITVGSIDVDGWNDNKRSSFSNYGDRVDIFAYGRGVYSTCYTNPSRACSLTGTSMASPFVAGMVAYFLSEGASADTVEQMLYDEAIAGVKSTSGSADRMLRSTCKV